MNSVSRFGYPPEVARVFVFGLLDASLAAAVN
jgi:hypothetical protein